jgi:hypothetical protein
MTLIAVFLVIPKTLNQIELTRDLHSDISIQHLKDNLSKFTGFKNRVFLTKTGVESAKWLHQQASKLVSEAIDTEDCDLSGYQEDELVGQETATEQSVSCDLFKHVNYDQPCRTHTLKRLVRGQGRWKTGLITYQCRSIR